MASENTSAWSSISGKAKDIWESVSKSTAVTSAIEWAKEAKEWVQEKLDNFRDREDGITATDEQGRQNTDDYGNQDESADEAETDGTEQAYTYPLVLDYSDMSGYSDADVQAAKFINLATLQFAERSADAGDGSTFDSDAVADQADAFTDYYTSYAELLTQYGNDEDMLDAEIDKLNSATDSNVVEVFDDTMYLYDEYETALENADDVESVYAGYPTVAYAMGDIDADGFESAYGTMLYGADSKTYNATLEVTDEAGVNTPESGDSNTYQTNLEFDYDSDEFQALDDDTKELTQVRNLAMLKFAQQDAVAGAVDVSKLEQQLNDFGEYYEAYSEIVAGDPNGMGDKITALNNKTDSEIVDMFDSVSSSLNDYEDAKEAAYNDINPNIPSSDVNKIMANFYESYSDPDVAYAMGGIDSETYASKLDDNLVLLSSDEYNSYVSSVRGAQTDGIVDEDDVDTDYDNSYSD